MSKWINGDKAKQIFYFGFICVAVVLALYAFVQYINKLNPVATFGIKSFLGCHLALLIPLIFCKTIETFTLNKNKFGKWIYLASFIFTVYVLILTKCRIGIIAVGISLILILARTYHDKITKKLNLWSKVLIGLFLILCIWFGSSFLYNLKPLSVIGRLNIWNVSKEIFLKNPLTGIGFSNFGNYYNLYQAEYFSAKNISPIYKITADNVRHAYSWYIETAVEMGIIGLVAYSIFWILILYHIFLIFKRNKLNACNENTTNKIKNFNLEDLGMACLVLNFMIISLVQFQIKIIPSYLAFNCGLAWIVTANQLKEPNVANLKPKLSPKIIKVIWLIAIIISTFFFSQYLNRYLCSRKWQQADKLFKNNKLDQSYRLYCEIYPKMAWNGRFLAYFTGVLLSKDMNAIDIAEKAKFTFPAPQLFTMLGLNYMNLSNSNLDELRNNDGSSLKEEEKMKYRNDYIDRGVYYLKLSSNSKPWRLTPKFYLMNVFSSLNDTNNTIKYAQLVVNTPMKKWTKKGEEMKQSAQDILKNLGVKCNDPGLVVFDIHNKNTWNEGKW